MTLNEYQQQAMTTCTPSSDNFSYMMLNLVGEVGEFSSKVAKAIRKSHASIDRDNQLLFKDMSHTERRELIEGLVGEAGDILWQLSGLCHVLGMTLEEVAQINLEKLASRQQRGKIIGDGDNR